MNSSIGFMLLLQAALIALNAVFACAEIAVISMNDAKLARLAAAGNQKASRLIVLTSQPARFLATIQVAITLSGFLGSAFAAENFSDVLVNLLISLGAKIPRPTLDAAAVILITLILSYFTLVFGELVPKRVAMGNAEPLALGLSGLIGGIAAVFRPIVWFLTASTNVVLRLLGIDPNQQEDHISEEEIRMMVDVGSEKGAIDLQEKEFIQNVFEFDDLTAAEIATHRTEMDILNLQDDMQTWMQVIHETRHTLYPVCEDSADCIIGILNAKDYFRLEDRSRENVMHRAVHPAYFVPESLKADVLLRNMKQQGQRMAVALDEYGGVTGIVTMYDLIEQLVGEMEPNENPSSQPSPSIEKIQDGLWQICGNASLDEIAAVTGAAFPATSCDTFAGLVFASLGTIPPDGKQDIDVQISGMNVHIFSVQDHQIARATLRIPSSLPVSHS